MPAPGVRLGLPTKLVPQQSSDANGAKWSSSTGTIQILLARRKEANPTTAKLAEQEKKEPAGRKIDYSAVKPDFFVLSGMQGLKKFYVRGQFKDSEVRILTILYDQATEGTMEPVVIAMSSAFNPFPAGAQAAGPPPRKTVEYGTGIVVSDDGAIVTDRQVGRRLHLDRGRRLRQCRPRRGGQGARPRPAADLRRARLEAARPRHRRGQIRRRPHRHRRSAKPGRRRGGQQRQIADHAGRQRQRSGAAAGAGLGFSGAAALDGDGKFAGIALLKPVRRRRAAGRPPPVQAVLVHADIVREFLKANGVAANGSSSDAKAAVVRVICVRK